MSDHEQENETETPQDLSSPQVAEKYRVASEIANNALKLVLTHCVPGADSLSLCILGDAFITNEAKKIYQKKDRSGKKVEKGVAFPTCISINEFCANFSPLDASASRELVAGDLVKVDLGVHIDGYIGSVGHSIVCCSQNATAYDMAAISALVTEAKALAVEQGAKFPSAVPESNTEIKGRIADVLKAAWVAGEAAIRQIHVGGKAQIVTKTIEEATKEFECAPMMGVMCHELKRHVIEGSKRFPITNTHFEDRGEDFVFEENEVYCIDIIVSTGEGKPKESELKPSVFRRAVERKYILKSQLGRHFMSEVESKFPALPFSLRHVEDSRACLVGVAEAMRHELLVSYPVLIEKAGEYVAQFKFTVQLLAGGLKKVTGLSFTQERQTVSSHEIKSETLKALLATSLNPKKNKKKNKEEKAN